MSSLLALALDVLGWAAVAGGSAFLVLGGVGLLRFPDVYTRSHAASLCDTLGAGLILIGLMTQASHWSDAFDLALILALLLLTGPVSGHALGSAALTAGIVPKLAGGAAVPMRPADEPTREDAP